MRDNRPIAAVKKNFKKMLMLSLFYKQVYNIFALK